MDQLQQTAQNSLAKYIGDLVMQKALLEAQVAFLQGELQKAKLPPLPDEPQAIKPTLGVNGHAAASAS